MKLCLEVNKLIGGKLEIERTRKSQAQALTMDERAKRLTEPENEALCS